MTETGSFTQAIVRRPAPGLGRGLTTSTEGPPDYERALEQHRAYVEVLERLGLEVAELDALPEFPDAYFVEDTAIIGDRFAVLARPGATFSRLETTF